MSRIKNYSLLVAAVIVIGAFLGWWWLWIPLFIWYGLYSSAWWLALLLVVVDAYYGSFYSLPLISLSTFVLLLILEIIRPYLYTTHTHDI